MLNIFLGKYFFSCCCDVFERLQKKQRGSIVKKTVTNIKYFLRKSQRDRELGEIQNSKQFTFKLMK